MAKDRRSKKTAAAAEAPPAARLTVKAGGKEVTLEARPEMVREELGQILDRFFQPAATAEAAPAEHDPIARARDPIARDPIARDPIARDPVEVSVTAPRPAAPAAKPPDAAGAAPRPSALESVARARGRQMIQPGAAELLGHATLDPESFSKLYSVDPTGKVCLLTTPHTANRLTDLLLLLLYGLVTRRGVSLAKGSHLLHGARSLGYKLVRVPRDFGIDDPRITILGRHRSKRYRLTAAGVRHCETLIPKLLAAIGD